MKKQLILLGITTILTSAAFAGTPNNGDIAAIQAKTYNWIVPDMKTNQNPMYANSFSRQRIQGAFDAALESKGMTRNVQRPDLLLQFHTYTQRVRRNYFGGGYPMMGGWGRFGWGIPFGGYYGGAYPSTTTNTDGTLILDVVDAKTGDVIWQRAITGDVSNPNKLTRQINKGVKKLMKSFPVRQS